MKDRYKFRVWHKKRKKMYEVLHLHVGTYVNGGDWTTAKGFNIITQQDIHIQVQPKDCLLMQCTGLKDENGKLIYFDDLVKLPWGEIGIVKAENKGENYGKVVLRNIANKKNIDVVCLFDYMNKCEVIGNVYENPELLKENKGE